MEKIKFEINPKVMFSGELSFLSNMHPCILRMNVLGEPYAFQSSEAAYQAGKCKNKEDVKLFAQAKDGYAAKRLGRKIEMRSDWDTYRLVWMKHVLNVKFTQHPELLRRLLKTYPIPLAETNTWNDTFWGICNGTGENHLGRLLMEIREEQRGPVPESEAVDVLTFEHLKGES